MKRLRFPYSLVKRRSLEALRNENAVLSEVIELYSSEQHYEKTAICIVFSMDRALQLHALLSSLYEKVRHPVPVLVLYRATAPVHQDSYCDVISIFSEHLVRFIEQKDRRSFKDQLVSLLEKSEAEKVFFLVDDIVFTEDVDMDDFVSVEPRTTVASLRLGKNLSRAYTVQRDQALPVFSELPGDKLSWRWDSGEWDWAYPLSVDGHLFSVPELLILTRYIEFSSPNTYESELQRFNKYFVQRAGVCYLKSKILNLPLNKVQNDNANIHGKVHQDYLVEQWNKGKQLDYRSLYGCVNQSAHQDVAIQLIMRTRVQSEGYRS